MTTRIYATEDESRLLVTAYGAGPELGERIQVTVTYGGHCTYTSITLEEAKDLCIRLAAYLGEQER